jgi:hypothetical protein
VNVDDVARIGRVALLLGMHDARVTPLVAASRELVVGASAHGARLELVMPATPEAFAALGVPARPADRLRVRVDGDDVEVLVVTATREPPGEPAWLDLVEQFCSIASARIQSHARGPRRQLLEIGYPARDRQTDAMLIEAIDQLGEDIGISAAQRRLFRQLHPQLGRGAEIVVTTGFTQGAVSVHLGLSYPVTAWETAVRLAGGLVLNDSEGQRVSRRLGEVAGALGSDRLTGLELVLGPHEPPDLVVWAKVASR